MMADADSVEAVQCKLGDIYILWPGTPNKPPESISDEDLFISSPRQFDRPHPESPIFEYEHNMRMRMWLPKKETVDNA